MIAPWYTMAYVKLTRIAMRYGYALALHGSMARDLDLIAIPWVNDAEPEKMLKAFARFITLKADVSYPIPKPTEKPHGRMAYSFPIGHNGHFLDISIMPRLEDRLEFLRDDGIGGMMNSHELAWKVIDYWIDKDYTSKADAIEELGDLDDLALRMMEVIEVQDLKESDGMTFISAQIDAELF